MEILYEAKEVQVLNYYCLITIAHRYDLTIGYTEFFLGKALVTSLQTGTLVLLCQEDLNYNDQWVEKLGIQTEDISELKEFFGLVLQTQPFQEQY